MLWKSCSTSAIWVGLLLASVPWAAGCNPGEEPRGRRGRCRPCAANSTSDGTGPCTACPDGTATSDGVTCVATGCGPGEELIGSTCTNCAANSTSDGTGSCTACPDGTASSDGVTCVDVEVFADVCTPVGKVKVRFPGADIGPGTQVRNTAVSSEDACIEECLADVQCNSAVFVTNVGSPGNVSLTCYLKVDELVESALVSQELRFVVVGCVDADDTAACNPGEEPTGSTCTPCAADSTSDGTGPCTACPDGTASSDGVTCVDVDGPGDVCTPAGLLKVRWPGADIGPASYIGVESVASEDACVEACLASSQCNSAVYVTKELSPGNISQTCYQKVDVLGESPLVETELRFVVVGCVSEVCDPGEALVGGVCTQCAVNTISPGTTACTACPENGTSTDGVTCIPEGQPVCQSTGTLVDQHAGEDGIDLAEYTGLTPDECRNKCFANYLCEAANYTASGVCYLKPAGVETAEPREGNDILFCNDPREPDCIYNEDCPRISSGPQWCTAGVCGARPKCSSEGAVILEQHAIAGGTLALQQGLTRDQCRNQCFTAVMCKVAVYVDGSTPLCHLKGTDPSEAVAQPGATSDVLYCEDSRTEHVPPTLTTCTGDGDCSSPGTCGAEGTCIDSYSGVCPPLATENLVTSGGAVTNPVSVAGPSNAVLLAYDHERVEFCPSELNTPGKEVLTISGQVIVRSNDGGTTTCKPCPEASCYVWQPNQQGTYVPECSGKLILDEYGRFTITANEPGNERNGGWGPDPYGHWHYDCRGCGGRYYNKFYRVEPDYVGENEATLSQALGYPDATNALTQLGGPNYTYTIVLEEGTYTYARPRNVTPY